MSWLCELAMPPKIGCKRTSKARLRLTLDQRGGDNVKQLLVRPGAARVQDHKSAAVYSRGEGGHDCTLQPQERMHRQAGCEQDNEWQSVALGAQEQGRGLLKSNLAGGSQ